MKNHWSEKLWYAYGTSMTSIEKGKYIPVVEKLSGLKAVNKGIGGGCITPDGFGKGDVKNAVFDLNDGKKDADLITLEVLPNEGAKVGDIYDTDDESFCGCFNQCLRFLQENTTATIVVILMIASHNCVYEQKSKKRGITQYEFSEIIKKVARLNSVPLIDVFGESGFGYARVKNGNYQVDHIHLNDLGGVNMGEFIWSKLKDIPVWKSEL